MLLIDEYSKQFKTQTDAATQLGTTRQQLYQWIMSSKPVFVHNGKVYRRLT